MLLTALVCPAFACGTSPQGTPVELSFGDQQTVAAGGAEPDSSSAGGSSAGGSSAGGSTAGGSSAGGSAGNSAGGSSVVPIQHDPPTVSRFTPSTGPWGTSVTITGTDLGSAARAGSQLTLGADLVLSPDDTEIQAWAETQIVFRVPFPHEGVVEVETPEGTIEAGTFTPSYEVAGAVDVDASTDTLASVSLEPGGIAVALNTNPITIVKFDGSDWTSTELPEADLRLETLRLYSADAETLAAFALSSDSPPEIVTLEANGDGWVDAPTGVVTSEDYLIAGGPDGAAVWFLDSSGWTRARPVEGVWQVDQGPITDPYATSMLNTAGATSDGSLWVVRSRDTGSLLNDKGAPFMRHLGADDGAFGSEFQMGDDLDDYLTSISVTDHGRGLLIEYCGSDESAVGGATDYECRIAGVLADGTAFRSIGAETAHARHAFSANARGLVRCLGDMGHEVLGEIWLWPCLDVAAFELDPNGAAVPAFRHDGQLKVLRRR